MVQTKKDPVLAVLSLSGGNDGLNCVIPRNNGFYRDFRPTLAVPEDQIIPINDELGFHPTMGPLKKYWDEGKLAVFVGIGYPTPSYSHFRSMDIWHTCEPEIIGTEGWLGRATKQLDPNSENVLTAVNFGRGLPRALAKDGVPVASVGDLETYGLLTGIDGESQRSEALDVFGRMYSPAIGRGAVMDYIRNTGTDALKGADMIKVAPELYSSTIEYGNTAISTALKDVAQVHLAGLGTQVFYTSHGPFDTHFNQPPMHQKLWTDVSNAVSDFFDDLKEHDAGDNLIMVMFTEFGRRVRDNGTGTDHGAAGGAFVIGNNVKGGMYGTYPSLKAEDLNQGDLDPNYDFRGFYATVIEKWLGLDAVPIVGGTFEQMAFV